MNKEFRTQSQPSRKLPELWQEITDHSDSMLNAARKKDWKQLNTLVLSRQKLLITYFQGEISDAEAELARQDIAALQKTDVEIEALTQSNKELLAEAMSRLQLGKNMAAQYLSNRS